MTERPIDALGAISLARATGRAARGALLGSALAALSAAGALGQTASETPATPAALESTGSIDDDAPRPDAAPLSAPTVQAPSAPGADASADVGSPVVQPLEPERAAVAALLANGGAGSGLRNVARDGAALAAFYAVRGNELAWIQNGRFTSQAEAARARIAAAADDGLDPRRYALPELALSADPAALARADATLTGAALAYARDAWGGRVNPRLVSRDISSGATPLDPLETLTAIAASADITATLDGFNPPHEQFQALRRLLAAQRAIVAPVEPPALIPSGRLIKPGDDDARVPALRARLAVPGVADDLYYDDVLAQAVMDFQREKKIGASGLINRQTLRALNADARKTAGGGEQTAAILLNMERWRWMPRDLGAKHVFVDIPAYELHIMQDGRSAYDTRVIVGKKENQTPIFSNAIDHIVVNPYWNVPASIALNEMRNSSLNGYEVVDSKGRKVSVDWEAIAANKLRIRQPPGERNALGKIKFMFPNSHAVYLHDTPSRKLFGRDERALSHGCVRVDRPLEFADALTGDQGMSGAKLKSMFGPKERRVNLATPIPVHLTYFTGWVDAAGELQTRRDIYGYDVRLQAALDGDPMPLPPRPTPKIAKAKPKAPPAQARPAVEPRPAAPATVATNRGGWLSDLFR